MGKTGGCRPALPKRLIQSFKMHSTIRFDVKC